MSEGLYQVGQARNDHEATQLEQDAQRASNNMSSQLPQLQMDQQRDIETPILEGTAALRRTDETMTATAVTNSSDKIQASNTVQEQIAETTRIQTTLEEQARHITNFFAKRGRTLEGIRGGNNNIVYALEDYFQRGQSQLDQSGQQMLSEYRTWLDRTIATETQTLPSQIQRTLDAVSQKLDTVRQNLSQIQQIIDSK